MVQTVPGIETETAAGCEEEDSDSMVRLQQRDQMVIG